MERREKDRWDLANARKCLILNLDLKDIKIKIMTSCFVLPVISSRIVFHKH